MTLAPTAATNPRSLRSYLLASMSLSGATGALVFWWASLFPTLLPRTWLSQAAISALSAASGYVIGVTIGRTVRWLRRSAPPEARTSVRLRRRRQILTVAAAVVASIGLLQWLTWQNEHRELVLLEPISLATLVPLLAMTGLVLALLIWAGRLFAWTVRRVDGFISRFMPRWVAAFTTALVVWSVVGFLATGTGERLVDWSRDQFGVTDNSTDPGITAPTAATVSGSPESFAAWDTLGRQGRTFVAEATTIDEIRAFSGADVEAKDPIRIYAGLKSAESTQARVELIIDEIRRTGGFDRKMLVVVTTTGTGWVDPDAARALEFMHRGDTTIVALQYSYLPSWISFLVDAGEAAKAGRAMNAGIREAWLALPESNRPELIVFGESLGSLGSEEAFVQEDLDASLSILTTLPDGALYSGPTFGNPIWRQLIEGRQEGTPVWRPLYDEGATTVVGNSPDELLPTGNAVSASQVAYLHHPSDPVGYWNPSLIWQEPDWMAEPIGRGVSPHVRWFPIVTFWQVVADLIAGFSTDPGFGHNYATEFVSGWAAVAAPDDWTDDDSDALIRHFEEQGG